MRLLQLEFAGILTGDDPLPRTDIAGQAVEHGGLARPGTAGDQDIASARRRHPQHGRGSRADRAVFHQGFKRQLVLLELANGEGRAIDRERRDDRIDPTAIGETCVTDRAALINPATDGRDDLLTDIDQVLVVPEPDRRLFDPPLGLDIDRVRPVHHDVGNVITGQQRLQRTIAENVVTDLAAEGRLLCRGQVKAAEIDDGLHCRLDILPRLLPIKPDQRGHINPLLDILEHDIARGHIAFGQLRQFARLDVYRFLAAMGFAVIGCRCAAGDRFDAGSGFRRGCRWLCLWFCLWRITRHGDRAFTQGTGQVRHVGCGVISQCSPVHHGRPFRFLIPPPFLLERIIIGGWCHR